MTTTYPTTVAPEWDTLEAFAALGAILEMKTATEETLIRLTRNKGETDDILSHVVTLHRAEVKLRAALGILDDDLRDDEEGRKAGFGR